MILLPLAGWCADGDTFTVTTTEGQTMTVMVLSEADKTCQVGQDGTPCIDCSYEGPVPMILEADANRNVFRGFSNFVNSNHGKNSLQNLFNAELSDEQKIQQIDDWWKEWIESEEKK